MELRNVYRCIMSPNSKFLAKSKQSTVTVCSAENARIEYGKVTISGGVMQYCFSHDSRNLAILSINGSLSIYDLAEEQGLTEKTRIIIEARWRDFHDTYSMFYYGKAGIVITPYHANKFANDIVLVDIDTKEQRLLYQSEYMFQSLTGLENTHRLFIVETTTLVDPLPARFITIDLEDMGKREIMPHVLFSRNIGSEEDLPSAIVNEDASLVFVGTNKALERYERIGGSYKLTLSKESPYPEFCSGLAKLGSSSYAIQSNATKGFCLISLDDLVVKKKYLLGLNGLPLFSISPCGRYAFFPTQPQRQPNGKLLGGWNVFMVEIERFIEGEYDQNFKLLSTV